MKITNKARHVTGIAIMVAAIFGMISLMFIFTANSKDDRRPMNPSAKNRANAARWSIW